MPQIVPWTFKTGPFSDDELATINAMAEAGKGQWKIARALGRHPSSVHYHMVKNGFCPVKRQKRSGAFMRGDTVVRPFTPEEDAFIEQRRIQGQGWARISRAIRLKFGWDRPPNSVGARLMMLAASDD